MIELFNINTHLIDTRSYSNLLHDKVVTNFEKKFADYVGAKYAVSFNSATSAIFLEFFSRAKQTVRIPSIIPPVVPNALILAGHEIEFYDYIDWVGGSYLLDAIDYNVIDSAQRVDRGQFSECGPDDLMIFSFYPTKPVGGCDGGIIVSDDLSKIERLREASMNGMTQSKNNWDRKCNSVGWKMYMNSIQADIASRNLELYDKKKESIDAVRHLYNAAFGMDRTSGHLYRINVDNRQDFISKMEHVGIKCGIHYKACHSMSVYAGGPELPRSTNEAESTVSIPFHEALSVFDVKKVIDNVQRFAKNLRP